MIVTSTESLNFRVNLRLNGGMSFPHHHRLLTLFSIDEETLFLMVKTHAEKGVYGVDPCELSLTEDNGTIEDTLSFFHHLGILEFIFI